MSNTQEANRNIIKEYISAGATPKTCGQIGLELEHIIVTCTTHEAVSYTETNGIREVLARLAPAYGNLITEEDSLIGLLHPDYSITIEPSGQMEISVAPRNSLAEIAEIYAGFREHLDPVLEELGLCVLETGYHPTRRADELELIPKERYRLMDAHFKTTGAYGAAMMRGSASTQVSIDYVNDTDAIRKFKIANLLGPLIAFVCDNTPVFNGDKQTGRMVRTRIWDDVDEKRCKVVPHLFSGGLKNNYTLGDYADTLMTVPPILVMEDGKAQATGKLTADQIYAQDTLTQSEIEHLLSMFFFDVRLKRYVEIRMADSLPIEYALSYAALVKGIFYTPQNLESIEELITGIDDGSIPQAKRNLMRDGYTADVYGIPAFTWLDELIALAWRGLPKEEQSFLMPLAKLIERRTTLYDESFEIDPPLTASSVQEAYIDTIKSLEGDIEGRLAANRYIQNSTALYHGSIVQFGYIPTLCPPALQRCFDHIATTMHGILCKMIAEYQKNADYRKLFGFTPLLEELVVLDREYTQLLPIWRMDIFLDKTVAPTKTDDLSFKFCEVNTDGTSAMNEDREGANALMLTPAFAKMSEAYALSPQNTFDPLVRMVEKIYQEWRSKHPGSPRTPRIAIVDFPANSTEYEFREFQKRFERHGMPCVISDIRALTFEDGQLKDHNDNAIDCVYRRAVTSDIMDSYDEVQPFIQAAQAGAVPIIGAFQTQIPHCKRSFEILHRRETLSLMSDQEVTFIKSHIPYTTVLDAENVDLSKIANEKDLWIIKPDDGYATSGVVAGIESTQREWEEALGQNVGGAYVLQEYCTQYAAPNLHATLDGDRLSDADKEFVSLNELIGLYVYDGRFQGTYTRANARGIIGSTWGADTLPGFYVSPKR